MLNETFEDSRIGHYFQMRRCPLVSHLLYANDMLLLVNIERKSLRKVLKMLATYEEWFGQVINKEKSILFMSNHNSNTRKRDLIQLTGFSEG